MIDKKKVAVFLGGRSPEHDVSVISGLQVLQAIDQSLYDAFPVYISPAGAWYVGDILRKRESYLLNEERMKHVTEVTLDTNARRGGRLISKKTGMFGGAKSFSFDIALPIFHGLYGEDGSIQGLFEMVNVPYAGMRVKASSILMDKVATKYFMQALDIPVLPFGVLRRPVQGYVVPEDQLKKILEPIGFPCIIKPSHLGSSIGVGKANNIEEAKALLPAIFEYDDVAIAEPYVENLVEYNVCVSRMFGETRTSAIEKPKSTKELLDFKEKYMSGSDSKTGDKLGNKTFSTASEGMLSLTREINPELPEEMESDIRRWAVKMFEAIDGLGAPRIDFIGNRKTGEIWINEVNPCPGSLNYFLWEAEKQDPVFFTDLLSSMISEAVAEHSRKALPFDPVPEAARLLKRS